jgi:hypothetical protein
MNSISHTLIRRAHGPTQLVMVLLASLLLAMVASSSLGAESASAAYQGPFCSNVFLWENEVCNSNHFNYSRRVTGNSYKDWTWVALYGLACGTGDKCRSAECRSTGCTADTGYYGSYGAGCGTSCTATIQNNLSNGDHYFGHIYE